MLQAAEEKGPLYFVKRFFRFKGGYDERRIIWGWVVFKELDQVK